MYLTVVPAVAALTDVYAGLAGPVPLVDGEDGVGAGGLAVELSGSALQSRPTRPLQIYLQNTVV